MLQIKISSFIIVAVLCLNAINDKAKADRYRGYLNSARGYTQIQRIGPITRTESYRPVPYSAYLNDFYNPFRAGIGRYDLITTLSGRNNRRICPSQRRRRNSNIWRFFF